MYILGNINVQSANYPVDNPSDYWKISLYFVFLETLDHLVEEISKRVVSNEERFLCGVGGGGGILSKPRAASLLNTTPDCSIPNREIYQGK